jgi:hypothetical protein
MNLESAAHAIGKDGFNWWIGQVENDGSDPPVKSIFTDGMGSTF